MTNFSNYDSLNAKTTNYVSDTRKDEINNYLKEINKVRDVDFEDICIVTELMCRNIVLASIKTSDMTVDGISRSVTDFSNINNVTYSDKGLSINCTIEYIPSGEYVISAPYKTQINITVRNNKDVDLTFGASAFEITINNNKRFYNTDVLYSLYSEKPEAFDLASFCKL